MVGALQGLEPGRRKASKVRHEWLFHEMGRESLVVQTSCQNDLKAEADEQLSSSVRPHSPTAKMCHLPLLTWLSYALYLVSNLRGRLKIASGLVRRGQNFRKREKKQDGTRVHVYAPGLFQKKMLIFLFQKKKYFLASQSSSISY